MAFLLRGRMKAVCWGQPNSSGDTLLSPHFIQTARFKNSGAILGLFDGLLCREWYYYKGGNASFHFVLAIDFSKQTLLLTNIHFFTCLSLIKPKSFLFHFEHRINCFGILPRENGRMWSTQGSCHQRKQNNSPPENDQKEQKNSLWLPHGDLQPNQTIWISHEWLWRSTQILKNQRRKWVQQVTCTKLLISNQFLTKSWSLIHPISSQLCIRGRVL